MIRDYRETTWYKVGMIQNWNVWSRLFLNSALHISMYVCQVKLYPEIKHQTHAINLHKNCRFNTKYYPCQSATLFVCSRVTRLTKYHMMLNSSLSLQHRSYGGLWDGNVGMKVFAEYCIKYLIELTLRLAAWCQNMKAAPATLAL